MSALSDDLRAKIRGYFERYPTKQAVTLPALHVVQDAHRCVSRRAVEEVADMLDLSPAQVQDTLSFYGFFRDEHHPLGRRRVWVCRSLSCMLRGGEELLAEACRRWGIAPGQTTGDGRITLEAAECLGACDGAPCVLVDEELVLGVSADALETIVERTP